MLHKGQSYFIDYYLNQKVYSMFLGMVENYALFADYNQFKKYLGYRLVLSQKYKFKKIKVSLNCQQVKEYKSIFEILEDLKEKHKIIRIYSSKKQIQGYLMNLFSDFILLKLIDIDADENGIVVIPINYIDIIYWDGEEDRRLEKLVQYSKINKSMDEITAYFSKGNALCEIYHSGFQTFILGKCLKVSDSHYLIESVNMSGKVEGFILLHCGLIDFICLETKYIRTYDEPKDRMTISNITNFFDFIISEGIKFDITTEKKKEYSCCSLMYYDESKIIVKINKKKKIFYLENIDIFDACIE